MPFIPSIVQTTVAWVLDRQQWMNVELFLSIRALEAGRGWPPCNASLGLIRLRIALCISGHCWILIPPSNIRPIDFFPEGCFCLHNYWIDFKQRGSSVCPRVHFFVKETALNIACAFSCFSCVCKGTATLTQELPRGLIYSKICNCKIKDNWATHRRKSDKSFND